MVVPATVRPHRSLVFPFFVTFSPMIWFVYRETPVRIVDGQQVATPLSRTLSLAILSVLASYAIAVVVSAAVLRKEPAPPWRRFLFQPTNETLVTLLVLSSVIVVYVALGSAFDLPSWAELVVGIPLLWPLLATILLMYAVGNAVPVLQAVAFQVSATVVGLALSAAWMFLLSSWISNVLSGTR